jgi:hypothetical protein
MSDALKILAQDEALSLTEKSKRKDQSVKRPRVHEKIQRYFREMVSGHISPILRPLRGDMLVMLARLAASRNIGPIAGGGAIRVATTRDVRSFARRSLLLVGARGPRLKRTEPNPKDPRKSGTKHLLIKKTIACRCRLLSPVPMRTT